LQEPLVDTVEGKAVNTTACAFKVNNWFLYFLTVTKTKTFIGNWHLHRQKGGSDLFGSLWDLWCTQRLCARLYCMVRYCLWMLPQTS
jgi:hypothetical protein